MYGQWHVKTAVENIDSEKGKKEEKKKKEQNRNGGGHAIMNANPHEPPIFKVTLPHDKSAYWLT